MPARASARRTLATGMLVIGVLTSSRSVATPPCSPGERGAARQLRLVALVRDGGVTRAYLEAPAGAVTAHARDAQLAAGVLTDVLFDEGLAVIRVPLTDPRLIRPWLELELPASAHLRRAIRVAAGPAAGPDCPELLVRAENGAAWWRATPDGEPWRTPVGEDVCPDWQLSSAHSVARGDFTLAADVPSASFGPVTGLVVLRQRSTGLMLSLRTAGP